MYSITALLIYAMIAELIRRCCMILIKAFTGPLSKIPGPFLNKLISLPWLYECMTGNMMNITPAYFAKYGEIVRVAPNECIVGNRDAIHRILVEEDFRKSPVYETIREKHDVTSLFSETDKVKYKQRRRLLSPGFSISYLNGLEPLVQECIQVFIDYLNQRCDDGHGSAIVDMSRVLGNLTSDVMSATSFGGSFNLVVEDDQQLKDMFIKRLARAAIDAQFPFLKHVPFVPPSNAKEMNAYIDRIIDRRRREIAAGEPVKKDLVQILVDTNDADPIGFSTAHIREEMMLFMFAGSDTTSVTVTFTLLLLLNNPGTLEPLIAEIDQAFPTKSDTITFAETQDLPYLNAVLNESMRCMPIVSAGLARQATEATSLCNYEIPAGTLVAAFLSEMMSSSAYWPDGKSFIPERWLGPYKGVEADRKAFMPFSAGSRNCIGQQFALKELRLILANLVRHFDLSLVEGQSHELRIFTTPQFKQGFYDVGVKRRA